MNKVGKLFGCFLPIIVALLCQIAISFGFSIIWGVYMAIQMEALGITDYAEQEAYLAESMGSGEIVMIITVIATSATVLIGALWYRSHKPATDFKLKEVVNGKLLLAMACLGLSLQLLVSMCLNAVYPILPQSLTEQYSELMEQLLGGNIWLSLFATVILAPLAEELLFRGITLKKAQKIMPFMTANVLQALLFGIYHLNWIQGVYAFALGIILGFTAEYFHSVWAAILLHAFVNGSAELLGLLPEALTETYMGVAAVALVGIILLYVAAKLYPKAKKEPVAEVVAEETPEIEMFRENSFDE